MAKTIYKYDFITSGNFEGSYSGPITTNTESTSGIGGDLCQPGNIVKIAAGGNSWSQDPQIITGFLNSTLDIESLQSTNWTIGLKDEWIEAYMKHVGLKDLIPVTSYTNYIKTEAENLNLFEKLSGPSVGWVTKSSTSGEVSIGLNAYTNTFIKDYALTLPNGNILRNAILDNHTSDNVYITNCAKVNYQSYSDIVYGFDAYDFDLYNLNALTMTPSLENGGGKLFGEVKLGGSGIKAHYVVKKNVDKADPTVGICSGELGKISGGSVNFCMGDELILVDSTIWTENFGIAGTGGWTWIGDYSQLNYTWHIADVSNPCIDYRFVPISSILMPFRFIQNCRFDDFG